jgi:transmembrane protein TMEM174 (potassium channel)
MRWWSCGPRCRQVNSPTLSPPLTHPGRRQLRRHSIKVNQPVHPTDHHLRPSTLPARRSQDSRRQVGPDHMTRRTPWPGRPLLRGMTMRMTSRRLPRTAAGLGDGGPAGRLRPGGPYQALAGPSQSRGDRVRPDPVLQRPPAIRPPAPPRHPQIGRFAYSFAAIGLFWLAHHGLFRHIKGLDRPLVLLNLLFLATIAFVPYPTALLSTPPSSGTGCLTRLLPVADALPIGSGHCSSPGFRRNHDVAGGCALAPARRALAAVSGSC